MVLLRVRLLFQKHRIIFVSIRFTFICKPLCFLDVHTCVHTCTHIHTRKGDLRNQIHVRIPFKSDHSALARETVGGTGVERINCRL